MMQDNSEKRLTGTVAKRNGARVFIREASQPMGTHDKVTNFLHSQSLRHAATGPPAKLSLIHMPLDPKGSVVHLGQKEDGWNVKVGDAVSFLASNVPRKPNPVANDAFIISPDELEAVKEEEEEEEPEAAADAPASGGETLPDFWRRCPICPGVVAESVDAWEAHLAGEEHAQSLRGRTGPAGTAVGGAPVTSAPPAQSRFPFAQAQQNQATAPQSQQAQAADKVQQQQQQQSSSTATNGSKAGGDSSKATASAQTLVIPRHSPDDPVKLTVTYKNNFIMEYAWPDVSIPTAVLRKANRPDVIRRQWIVQRLEVVMGEMDEQLPRTAFQNSALDWRESFLTRLEMHTGERWTWKKIDGELCLGEGKTSATFWRSLRVGIQSFAHATHPNILVVKPANATQKMLFGKCHPSELPRSWEIPTHGKFIRLSFVRPELVFAHHQRLNNTVGTDDMMREVTITTEIDVPSLMPMWRLDWRSLMAMPEPIFPGAIHVVGSVSEAPRAIEKLVASCAPDGLIGLWGEWSGDTKGHEYNRLQVIQLATERCSVVFKVGLWKSLPPAALELFTHRTLRTVALGGQEITKKLRKDFKVDVTNGIDVLDLPAAQRCQPRSLKGLVGVFLNWNVGMDQAQSPWDAPRLTPGQLTHAATRPWLVLVLYRKILTIVYDNTLGVVEGTLSARPANLGV